MNQITIKTPYPKCRFLLKNLPAKRDLAAGVYLSKAPWGGNAILKDRNLVKYGV
jgi:hypothetical protein